MPKHLMIDLETLSTSPKAVVLTLGAVTFDPHSDRLFDQLYIRLDLDDQTALNREIDQGTVDWWSKQNPKVVEDTFSLENRIPLAEAINQFHKFAWGSDKIWSHGAIFDIVILENIYQQLNKPVPWDYWRCRDTRTLFDLADPEMEKSSEQHNSLFDAVRQARGVQTVYRKLGLTT